MIILEKNLNQLISFFKSDWINSHPVFYNSKTQNASHNINDVVDWGNFEFDNEGLFNYLKFGYIVFDKTVFKDVFRLPPNCTLEIFLNCGSKILKITQHEDIVINYLDGVSSPEECINKLKNHVDNFEKNHSDKRFLLPLSGGHDSRLLLSMLNDKSKIDAITYDVSMSQKFSAESINAQFLANKFDLNWKNVILNKYFTEKYCLRNFNLFGLEMPIHASYHMEMYDLASKLFDTTNSVVISGSVGDWWSGEKVALRKTNSWQDAENLFFNHGISISEEFICLKHDSTYNESIIQPKLDLIIESDAYRTVFSRRGRVGLASYIARVAESSLPTYTPFYDIDIAMSQLRLPDSERVNRFWQKKYFHNIDLGFGLTYIPHVSMSGDYSQDLQAAHNAHNENSLTKLNPNYFDGIIKADRIHWINNTLDKLTFIPLEVLKNLANSIYANENIAPENIRSPSFGNTFDQIY